VKAADRHARKQLVRDLALVAALIATHQQDAFLPGDIRKARADRVAVDQHEIVVLEKEHPDDGGAMPILFELRQDHFGQHVGHVMALGGKDVGDLHGISPVGNG
jgi:hypothetical protein